VRTAATQGLGLLRREATRTRAQHEDPAARARRQHAARHLRTWTDTDGMITGRFSLPPEIGAPVLAVLAHHTRRIFRSRTGDAREPIDACAADALVELVTRPTTPEATASRRSARGSRTPSAPRGRAAPPDTSAASAAA